MDLLNAALAFAGPLAKGVKALRGASSVDGPILFGQKSVSSTFTSPSNSSFKYAGDSIADVASGLRSGAIHADELPIQYIARNGQNVALNNRSLLALRRAGVEPTRLIDMTGNAELERRLTGRLAEMGGSASDVTRVRGGAPNASLFEPLT
jgi:hypothetical protein